jgi:cardiolipin synthase
MNLPNILTISRIFLVPVLIIVLINEMALQALFIFIYAGVSDALDGFIARYFNQKTMLGAYLDPLADKLLITSSYITLAILAKIPGWICVIVISRDVLILSGILTLYMWEVSFEIRPSFVSKCTTTIQLVTIFLVLIHAAMDIHYLEHSIGYFYFMTAVFSIVSGFHYTYKGINLLQRQSDESDRPR